MAKNSVDAYGASGKSNVLFFAPEALHLVNDPQHSLYDERIHLSLDEAMVLNIMDQGVLEPIIVWKNPETGKTCVVDGQQRVKHSQEANRRLINDGKEPLQVPGVVRRGSARRMAEAMVSANEIKRPDTPLGRAKKMAAMLAHGNDEEDMALFFGVSIQTVQATLALLECTQAVQDAVESGAITTGHARQLSELPPDEQREKVKELVSVAQETKGHQKARRQRELLGNSQPRMKSRKQISVALTSATGEYAAALRWVIGEVGDQWRTPEPIFWGINALYGPLVLDLFADESNAKCEAYYTAEENALAQDWSARLGKLGGAAFANPPYSRASLHDGQYITGMVNIMEHTMAMRECGGRYVVLIKAATSETWWPEQADHIAFIRGRIGFDVPTWFKPADAQQVPTGAFFAGAIAVFDKTWTGPAVGYVNRDDLIARGKTALSQMRWMAPRLIQRQNEIQNIPENIPTPGEVVCS